MAAFAQAVGAPRCALLLAHSDGPDYSVVRWHGWPDQDVQLYLDKYGQIDPLRLVSRQAPEGTIAADYDIYPRDRYESSVIFQEFLCSQTVHSLHGRRDPHDAYRPVCDQRTPQR